MVVVKMTETSERKERHVCVCLQFSTTATASHPVLVYLHRRNLAVRYE